MSFKWQEYDRWKSELLESGWRHGAAGTCSCGCGLVATWRDPNGRPLRPVCAGRGRVDREKRKPTKARDWSVLDLEELARYTGEEETA